MATSIIKSSKNSLTLSATGSDYKDFFKNICPKIVPYIPSTAEYVIVDAIWENTNFFIIIAVRVSNNRIRLIASRDATLYTGTYNPLTSSFVDFYYYAGTAYPMGGVTHKALIYALPRVRRCA